MTDRPPEEEVRKAIATLRATPFRDIQRLGFHFQTADFYSPLHDCDFLEANQDLWRDRGTPRDIDWNLERQIETAHTVSRFVDELRDVPDRAPNGGAGFHWQNDFWNNADALVQYGLVRDMKPRRVVEVGCGWSSLLLARAIERNGTPTDVTLVEPYPNRRVFAQLPKSWTHHETILQRAPLEVFESLQAGDFCFYDGSHCAKIGSDVDWFFFEVLPRLAAGVVVHLHDIFLPDAYPDEWIFERGQTWNEQQVLRAFLMNNERYEILIANRFLFRQREALLADLYKGVQPPYGCSFWMRKRGG